MEVEVKRGDRFFLRSYQPLEKPQFMRMTGKWTWKAAACRLSYSQVVPAHLRGGLRELSHFECSEPGQGQGTKLLNDVIKEADKHNITLMLTAETPRLADWYARFGFKTLQETPNIMVRLPARVMAAYG